MVPMLRLARFAVAMAAAALLATLPVRTSEPAAQEGLTPAVLAHVAVLCALWLGRLSAGSLPW